MGAESGHGRYYLFSYCYLEITIKSFVITRYQGSFSRDKGISELSSHDQKRVCGSWSHIFGVKFTASSITDVWSSEKLQPGSWQVLIWMFSLTERHSTVSACVGLWLKCSLLRWSIDTFSVSLLTGGKSIYMLTLVELQISDKNY